jgi:hypothetical protein
MKRLDFNEALEINIYTDLGHLLIGRNEIYFPVVSNNIGSSFFFLDGVNDHKLLEFK